MGKGREGNDGFMFQLMKLLADWRRFVIVDIAVGDEASF